MDPYKELLETRRKNLPRLVGVNGGNSAVAALYGCSTSYISQLLSGKRNINERTARRLEEVCGSPARWLDKVR